jgi:hypothetical protein
MVLNLYRWEVWIQLTVWPEHILLLSASKDINAVSDIFLGMSEGLLFDANAAIFHYGENKLFFKTMMMRSALY